MLGAGGDDHVVEVERLQEWPERGDLVALTVRFHLAERHPRVLVQDRQQMDRRVGLRVVAGAAQALAIHVHHTSAALLSGRLTGVPSEPNGCGGAERLGVDLLPAPGGSSTHPEAPACGQRVPPHLQSGYDLRGHIRRPLGDLRERAGTNFLDVIKRRRQPHVHRRHTCSLTLRKTLTVDGHCGRQGINRSSRHFVEDLGWMGAS